MQLSIQQTTRIRRWAGLFAALLLACGFLVPGTAQADLASLIKELQQCQRSTSQLRACENQKNALARNLQGRIKALQGQIVAKNLLIRKLQKRLGIKPTVPVRPLSQLAKLPGARESRVKIGTNPKDATTGPNNALVTVIEFSDFQCPFCNRGAKTIGQIKKAYGNKVRVIFKHLPLSFHKQAHIAAQAALSAKAQGKFWAYHDKLFANYRNINKANLIKWAKELGLDATKVKADLDSGKYRAQVDADLLTARKVGARGTPTFFINGRRLVGAQPYYKFKQIIDQELKLASALLKNGTPQNGLMDALIKLSRTPAPAVLVRPTPPSGGTGNTDNTGSPVLGPSGAKVTIIEFSDFQCPFCSRGAKTMKQIAKAYGDKVRIVFKHNPLSFHRQAHIAAQASMAAHAQGKFWAYHDKLFANYRNINKANLVKWARELGLNADKVKAALDSGKYKAKVDADLALGRKMGVRGTPNFFVNGKKVAGAYPFSHFKKIIDGIISGKAPSPSKPAVRPVAAKPVAGNAPSMGPKNAKVTIIEFSDFQCPFCNRAAKTMKRLVDAYKGKVRLVFKHRPLSFHRQAHIAAQASMAAHAQGKFWPFHDKLFANYRSLNKANFVKWAKELGLDVAKFKADLDSGKYKSYVDRDNSEAVKVGAGGTPTFFINGQKVVGAQPYNRFKAVVDGLLSGKKPVVRRPTPAPARPHAHKHTRVLVKINDNDAYFGPKDAPITIVEFSDFQCPFCSRGAKVMDQVKKAFGGQVRIVFKHLPLPFHKQAHIAAQAALAANAQGKFWAYHDKLFANYRNINKANLVKWAKELGLDADKVKADLDSGKYKAQVDRDLAYSRTVGARGTPNFFVNGRKVAGAYPFSHFQKLIKEELAHVAKLRKQGVPKAKIYEKLMESAKDAAAAARLKKLRETARVKAQLKQINLDQSPSFGPKDAKVTIIEFSDFQCPFCARGAKIIDQVKKAYGNKVRIVFKHLPLSFHRQAHIAAQASMAAHAQGKFWAYHDKLFANYRNINKDNLVKWAKELGLDADKFQKALDQKTYKKFVDNDLATSRKMGVRGTPNFFVNGRKVVGAQPFSRFKAIIDAELKR